MTRKWKRISSIALVVSMITCFSCNRTWGEKKLVLPKSNGTAMQQVEYHKKEILKYKSKIEKEERSAQIALSKQDMDEARSSQNRKMRYKKKVEQHTAKIHKLRGNNGIS